MSEIIAAPKSKKKKFKANKVDQSMVSTIERLKQNDGLVDNTIIFRFLDGSSKVSKIGKQFVVSEKGKYLPTHAIIENMNALQSDYGADSYDIE